MIEVGHVILTDDIRDEYFVCDLVKCKGACCVEGDLGAPLEMDELEVLEEIYPEVEPYLSEKGKNAIEKMGKYIFDKQGEYSTPTIRGKECAYAIYDENKVLYCGIEKAFRDGKIDYQKPISCHLYPLRLRQYERFTAVNYDRWYICKSACAHGENLKVPLYKFLKGPLERKFGREWYKDLLATIDYIEEREEND